MLEGCLVTTVRRGGALEHSGDLLLFEPNSPRPRPILSVPSPVYPHLHANKAFGGKRGFRGVRRWQKTIVVATFDSVLVVNEEGQLLERITHPWLCDVHGIAVTAEGVWAASTGIDAVVLVGWEGAIRTAYFLGEEAWQVPPRRIPRNCDFRRHVLTNMRVHPNYISLDAESLFVCCRRLGMLVHIDRITGYARLMHEVGRFSLPHDGRIVEHHGEKWFEVTETETGRLHVSRMDNGVLHERRVVDLARYGALNSTRPASRGRTNWLRGLAYMGDETHVVGQAPARLVVVRSGLVVGVIRLDDHPDSAVSDICPP